MKLLFRKKLKKYLAIIIFALENDILRLDVSVHNFLGVEVEDCTEDLFHVLGSFVLVKVLHLGDFVEQFPTVQVLHDDEEIPIVLVELMDFD